MSTLTHPNVRTTPFVSETKDLANRCFERHFEMTKRDLNSETPRADIEAYCLILTGFQAAIRDAQRAGNEMLALHFTELLTEVKRAGAYVWLNGLAIDGGGR